KRLDDNVFDVFPGTSVLSQVMIDEMNQKRDEVTTAPTGTTNDQDEKFAICAPERVVCIIEFLVGWTQIKDPIRGSCEAFYTNIYVQIFNIIFAFTLPMFLNMLMIYASVHHVHLTSVLQWTEHHVSARIFWSPYIIVSQMSLHQQNLMNVVTIVSFVEVACDPIIVAALDIRFWHQ
ncbi:unnamed protein product, partial [Rotaria sordida]